MARLLEPPDVHLRVELVDDSTSAVPFSRASKLACCRIRHADANMQLEVGGHFLSTREAILKLSCMFRCSCRMLILPCSASPQQPVCRPNALDERRRFFYCCFCDVRSARELPMNGSRFLASYQRFVCVVMPLVRRKCRHQVMLAKNGLVSNSV